MSKRKENIRKICDDISAIGMLLKVKTGKVNCDVAGDILIKSAHRIKRTTWRGETVITKSKPCNTGSLTDWEKLCNKENA